MDTPPEPKKQSAIEFAKEKLGLNPEATYADIKAQAKFEGIPIFPVVYGRAKALLGLVPTAPYGSKSKARKEAAEQKEERNRLAAIAARDARETAPRESGGLDPAPANGGRAMSRTARAKVEAASPAAKADPAASLESMIEDLRLAVRERDRYRAVLTKIAGLIQEELRG